ncbi:putative transposase [Arcticibacter svalbardensis MN12-7]|uniref:Putative transposase n=2 Tax=Arcticibacter TaxID=1288026 RepID=R9GR96_9SPHI|nr:putative transposase [Arcticibacter svalbardensis MN12-7]
MLIIVPNLYLKSNKFKTVLRWGKLLDTFKHFLTKTYRRDHFTMSSNIRIRRVCLHCGKEFEARTTVTNYCSSQCSKRAYKSRIRIEKISKSNVETNEIINKPILDLLGKEFLTVREVASLLNSSKQTVYTLIKSGTLLGVNIKKKKTLVRRSDIDRLFEIPEIHVTPVKKSVVRPKEKDCYYMAEIQTLFGLSEKALFDIIKRNNIPKYRNGRYVYISKKLIHQVLNY